MSKSLSIIKPTDSEQYDNLVSDCKDMTFVGLDKVKAVMIEVYKHLGERIISDQLYIRFGKANGEFIKKLALDVDKGKTTVYYAIQFAKKMKEDSNFHAFVENSPKEISWKYIKALLPNKVVSTQVESSGKPIATDGVTTDPTTGKPVWDFKCPSCGCVFNPKEEKNKEVGIERQIVADFCKIKGYRGDHKVFARSIRTAKLLLNYLGSPEKVRDCMCDLADEFNTKGLDWELETILKHAPRWEAMKNGK